MATFRTAEIVSILGVTARMLDRWVSAGVVAPSVQSPPGSGVDRVFSFQDLIAVAVVAKLRSLGVSLDGMRPTVAHLSTLAFHERGEAKVDYLVCFSKGEVLALKVEEVLEAIEKRRGQNVILVDLAEIFVDLQGASMEVALGRTRSKIPRKRTAGEKPRRRPRPG